MTEAPVGSKENPSPLDAYATAEPTEPTFTLQGGDPLAASLVRLWAYLTRVRTGMRGDVAWIATPIYAAESSSVEDDKEQCKNLLKRATEAEQISWYMDGYRRGETSLAEQVKELSDLEKLDIYDVRRRCATSIHYFWSELKGYQERLTEFGFMEPELDNSIEGVVLALRSISDKIGINKKTFNEEFYGRKE